MSLHFTINAVTSLLIPCAILSVIAVGWSFTMTKGGRKQVLRILRHIWIMLAVL